MREAAKRGIANIESTLGDAQALPYDDDSFDAAYLVTVLGEIPDQDAALRELARVVRPGGRLVVGELFGDPTWSRSRSSESARGGRASRSSAGSERRSPTSRASRRPERRSRPRRLPEGHPVPMKVGIVGLPNAGKSTLFNALTRAGAEAAEYPFTTVDPNVAVVPVPDSRLDSVARHARHRRAASRSRSSSSTSPAWCAERTRARGSATASSATSATSTRYCTSCARSSIRRSRTRTASWIPAADLETVETELLLADLETAERRLADVERRAGGGEREARAEAEFWRERRGRPARRAGRRPPRPDLLTSKPALVVANVGEGEEVPEELRGAGRRRGLRSRRGRAERARAGGGGVDARRARASPRTRSREVVSAAYGLLGLVTFFTAVGEQRGPGAQPAAGRTALEAAGRVHTDMERGLRARGGDRLAGPGRSRLVRRTPASSGSFAPRAATTSSRTATS